MLPDWTDAQRYLPELKDAFEKGKKVTATLPGAIEPPYVDRRLAAQASRFLIYGTTKDLMRTDEKSFGPRGGWHLAKILIPGGNVGTIRRELDDCGVSPLMIRPDLEGLCEEICRRWRPR